MIDDDKERRHVNRKYSKPLARNGAANGESLVNDI